MAQVEIVDVAAIIAQQTQPAAVSRKGEILREATKPAESSSKPLVEVRNPYPPNAVPARSLEEEDYVEAVSALIERDFFPDLAHLRARHELMQARLRGDNALARALEKKLLEMPRPTPKGTPHMVQVTPAPSAAEGGGETPIPRLPGAAGAAAARLSAWEKDDGSESVASANAGLSVAGQHQALLKLTSGREVLVDLSSVGLDEFQQVFTSEDNASFEAVLEKDRQRRREKEWWVEGPELKHNTKCKEQALDFDKVEVVNRPGTIMTCEFQARNTLYFKPKGELSAAPDKPAIECRNTRFTSQEQSDLDETLMAAIAAKHARENGLQLADVLAKMLKDGTFSVAALHNYGQLRAVGGRLETPINQRNPQAGNFNFVSTPAMAPGDNGVSPFMTFGKIASTPRLLEEEIGPSFRVAEESPRDRAAEKLARGAMQRQRESKQNSKKERLKALGLTPNASPASVRTTPASVASKVTPMTPIGQLLHRAQRMAQRGGRLRIGASRPPTEEREAKRPRTNSVQKSRQSGIPAAMMADLL